MGNYDSKRYIWLILVGVIFICGFLYTLRVNQVEPSPDRRNLSNDGNTCLSLKERSKLDVSITVWGNGKTSNNTATPPQIVLEQPPIVVSSGKSTEITVNIYIEREFSGVYLIYQINNGIAQFDHMELRNNFKNGTYIYSATLPAQSAGTSVNYTIVIFDSSGKCIVNSSHSYVVANVASLCPITPVLLILGTISSGITTYAVVKSYKKERKVKEFLSRITEVTQTTNCQVITQAANFSSSEEYYVTPTDIYECLSNRLERDSQTEQQSCAGQLTGYEFTFLFKVLQSILKCFPVLKHFFEGLNKIFYVKDLLTLEIQEQCALFKNLIGRNTETTIRSELDKLMIDINNRDINPDLEGILSKLNSCIDLAQLSADREYLIDIFLLVLLAKKSFL